jgi:hypothetical protein
MGLSDKDMAVIFKADARDYMIAAENLRTDEHSIYLVAPTYFLRSHAIELLLKACLLANGWTVKQCRENLGHQLGKAMNEAEAVGHFANRNGPARGLYAGPPALRRGAFAGGQTPRWARRVYS